MTKAARNLVWEALAVGHRARARTRAAVRGFNGARSSATTQPAKGDPQAVLPSDIDTCLPCSRPALSGSCREQRQVGTPAAHGPHLACRRTLHHPGPAAASRFVRLPARSFPVSARRVSAQANCARRRPLLPDPATLAVPLDRPSQRGGSIVLLRSPLHRLARVRRTTLSAAPRLRRQVRRAVHQATRYSPLQGAPLGRRPNSAQCLADRRWTALEFVYCLLNVRLKSGELLPRLLQLSGGNKLRWPIRGDNGGPLRIER